MATNPLLAYGKWLAETPGDWPEPAREAAHLAFIDIVGVALRGAVEEAPKRLLSAVGHWGHGAATLWGAGTRLPAPWAALVNGTSAHALDFDDNFDPGKAHATAVLAPAILALAEQEAASGADCIDAYIAGLQILGRVGQGVNPLHRTRGWHATATVGAIGAAAACSRLLRLDERQASHALSIATSMAGGFMSQFGTMTKPVHAGLAAKSGLMAASLARSGIGAGLATLDGPTGMSGLMVGPDYEQLREEMRLAGMSGWLHFETALVGEPLLILSPGLKVKRFPNCASAHRSMDILLELMTRHGFTAPDVRELRVRAPRAHLNNLMYTQPATPDEARFSLEFALAMLLVEGACGLSHFSQAQVARPEIRALYPKIARKPVDGPEGRTPTEVEVLLEDGRSFKGSALMAVGSQAAPFSREQLWEKFNGCVADLLGDQGAAALRHSLERFPELESLGSLMVRISFRQQPPCA